MSRPTGLKGGHITSQKQYTDWYKNDQRQVRNFTISIDLVTTFGQYGYQNVAETSYISVQQFVIDLLDFGRGGCVYPKEHTFFNRPSCCFHFTQGKLQYQWLVNSYQEPHLKISPGTHRLWVVINTNLMKVYIY